MLKKRCTKNLLKKYQQNKVWHGGEMEALSRLERHLERKAWVASFGLPKMTPQVQKIETNKSP